MQERSGIAVAPAGPADCVTVFSGAGGTGSKADPVLARNMTQSKATMRIGVLGTGNMGSAIIRGLLAAKKLEADKLFAADAASERLKELKDEFGIGVADGNRALVAQSNVVILAVKPQILGRVLDEVSPALTPNHLMVSIAAGVTLHSIEQALPSGTHVVRTMPNTPAVALASMTAIAKGSSATRDDVDTVRFLFEAIGRVVEVEESLLDAVTGLSGSGPAYVLLAIEAMADGGVRMGLPRPMALLLAAQTVFGTAKLVLESNLHPAQLRDNVTSPGGTTIAGLSALEEGAARHAFICAVRAATLRSIELGQTATKK